MWFRLSRIGDGTSEAKVTLFRLVLVGMSSLLVSLGGGARIPGPVVLNKLLCGCLEVFLLAGELLLLLLHGG
jgi:hypothetical protein